MKIFLSWSGNKSKALAALFKDWIVCVVQNCDPWMSTQIEAGSQSNSIINENLNELNFGILFLTKYNKEAPWILYEAGALSKGLDKNRICPLLIDLDWSEVKGPLVQYNYVEPNKSGILNLVHSIHSSMKSDTPQAIITRTFEPFWEIFKIKFDKIMEEVHEEGVETRRSLEDILTEVLETNRQIDNRLIGIM